MATMWSKYPDEVLDFQVDFAARLDGDAIRSVAVRVGGGVTADRLSHTADTTTFWLTGGNGPAMTAVAVVATTVAGRTLEHQVTLQILG